MEESTKLIKKITVAALMAATVAVLTGCEKKNDPIAQAAKKDVAAGVAAPGVAEVKAIAEEAFIYGLPLVMNYAVMWTVSIEQEISSCLNASNRR